VNLCTGAKFEAEFATWTKTYIACALQILVQRESTLGGSF